MIKVIDVMSGQIKEIPNKKERERMMNKMKADRDGIIDTIKKYEKAQIYSGFIFLFLCIVSLFLVRINIGILASVILIVLLIASIITFLAICIAKSRWDKKLKKTPRE